jgi:hypothetical protein
MSKITGLAVTMFLGLGGLLVSRWTHASTARRGSPAAEEVGLRTGVQTEDSLTFEVLGFKFNRLWIPFWPCSPRTVHESSWSTCALPENSTLDDLEVFNRAMVCHEPLPPGFPTPGHERRELARTTGAVDWMGRHEIQLRVTDGVGKLASAKLYLDYEIVSEATLDDGRIVDRGDESEATLDLFLPWIPQFTVTLITDDRDGRTEESSLSLGRSSLSSR